MVSDDGETVSDDGERTLTVLEVDGGGSCEDNLLR
jgi:hypothetical protein